MTFLKQWDNRRHKKKLKTNIAEIKRAIKFLHSFNLTNNFNLKLLETFKEQMIIFISEMIFIL